uniref:Uncharacterized protein n=1 Tax=Zosterops lateralis melanops TaxID=1220523 RepID=A0A8D2NRQ4_ZOSLA
MEIKEERSSDEARQFLPSSQLDSLGEPQFTKHNSPMYETVPDVREEELMYLFSNKKLDLLLNSFFIDQ